MSSNSEKAEAAKSLPFPKQGDEVVISGIAGRFPESDTFTHLKENLFNKRDLITDDDRRWKSDHPDIPQRTGKINNLDKFDSRFFRVNSEDAQAMDPTGRILLEHAYEAIIDAGVNPRQLCGTNTGVFVSSSFSESEQELMYGSSQGGRSGVLGCSRSMLANRISHWLGTTGPSYNLDTACSSSLFAMDNAYRAIRSGQCEAALVAGAQLCLNPFMSMQFSMLGVLCPDGRCKAFDADANGYARSEAMCVIYLQKAKDAKRIYANVVYTKTNCDGFKEQGITFPSSIMQGNLLQQFYEECEVPPTCLAYVEAHGTGTRVGDPVELNAIEKVFCPGRTTPLRIGSIKTNLGHSEPASGACSIAKVVVAMESGFIPPNLHYNRPREDIKALMDGRLEVITELTPWDGGYVGVNSFGFGGANAHILLKSNPKGKIKGGAPDDDLPRLVVVSGRTQEAVTTLLDDLESRPVDVEYLSLFHNIHAEEIPGHLYRGYTILSNQGLQENSLRDVQQYAHAKRPVWFVFSGIGSPVTGIGKSLLKIPAFSKAIQKCNAALKPHGVDIINVLTTKNPKMLKNILNSLVGSAAVQIGLIDVLASIGIVPDNIIGHSISELGCAYADGCLTAEQMVLAAYFQGLALTETITIPEFKSALGPEKVDFKSLCPSDTKIKCQSCPGRPRINSLSESVNKSISKLLAYDIFGKEEPCGKIACENRHITTADRKLLTCLQKVISDPKPRSKKWLTISASGRLNKWETISAGLFSAESCINNLLGPVLFEEISDHIPNDTIAIEIPPHGLMRTIIRRSYNGKVTSNDLANHENKDPIQFLLEAIGKMYEAGLHPQLSNLYPDVKHPVSRGTPMISPLVRWDHSDNWFVRRHTTTKRLDKGERVVQITLTDDTFQWMAGHMIDGRNLVPATGYLVLVWETVAMMRGELYDEVSVVFRDVRFHRATAIPKQDSVRLMIMVQKGSGRFEVTEGSTTVVTGFIHATSNPTEERIVTDKLTESAEPLDLTDRDIYKELRLRGYQYEGLFRGLKGASLNGSKGSIAWEKNWVAFMDNMLQMEILGMDTRGLFVPTGIQKLVIDPRIHLNQVRDMSGDDKAFKVRVHKDLGIITSGGVEIRGLKASAIARKKPAGDPVLENFKFVAHRDRAEMELSVVIRVATHLVLENHIGVKVKIIELIGESDDKSPENLTSPLIQEVLSDLPLLQANVNIIAPIRALAANALPATIQISEPNKLATESDALLVISHGIFARRDIDTLKQLMTAMKDSGFLLAKEPLNADADIFSTLQSEGLDMILEKRTEKELVLLLRKRPELPGMVTVIQIDSIELAWLSTLQAALKAENENKSGTSRRILLLSERDFESGLMGLVNCLRKEPGGQVIQGLLIQDEQAPKFSLENPFYSEQLDLSLALNVLRPGKLWGSYRFFAIGSLPLRPVHHIRIGQLTRGDLSSLKWVEGKIQPSVRHRDIVEVHYSSINFRDVMISTGKLAVEVYATTRQSQENIIGIEFSGRDVNGRAVMGMILSGAFSNLCVSDSKLLWSVPDNWTLEDAATVPVVYGTAYYALMMNGRMKKGDKVLIHAGSGGVGQAAITLALHEGCEVFTTVGTPEKRQFIKNQFPQIDDDHIGNSRDTSFEQLVLRKTQGRGVDIVLNSLAEEKLQASIRCLCKGGRFLEIGKFDLAANNPLGMEVFLKEITFHGVYLDNLFTTTSDRKTQLVTMLAEGLRNGAVKPLVRSVFSMDQTEEAFRYMAAGKHIGKVILKIRHENGPYQFSLPYALPRYHCLENGSNLILGGLGGFGLELADWLVLRGAKNLVLTSRRGIVTGYQRLRIDLWKSYGVKVVVIVGKDASTHEGCEYILKEAVALGPVDAIFNLAVVLRDSLCENQTVETFEEAFRPKAWATKQLDKLSRTLCPHLRQFVVFSSVSCGRGNAGQTNYGMSNSVMERICETRASENLPGLAVQWGAVGDVGLVAEMQEDHKEVVIGGTLQQKISSCLQELDGFLQQNSPVVSSMVVAEKIAGGDGAANIIDAVINIMGLKSLKTISLHTPLTELGLDSMMVVEIKQTLEREFEVFLTAEDIRGLNFIELEKISLKQAGGGEKCEKKIMNKGDDWDGIKLLIRTLGTDQLNKDICVPLVTATETERNEVFIVPGIEGTYTVFQSLASKLKSPTTCLQLDTSSLGPTSINDMADFLIPHVKARSKARKDFVIVGYSFGSLVAIELVRRLESEGLSGRLVLLDGSPEYLKALINGQLNATTDDELQSNVLLGMMDLLVPHVSAKLATELQDHETWETKLAAFTKIVPENRNLNFTADDQKLIYSAVYYRIKAVQIYDNSALSPLRTPIILLRPKIQSVHSMSEDYGLGLLTREKVEVHYVEGNHVTMLDDDFCAAAIDGELVEG